MIRVRVRVRVRTFAMADLYDSRPEPGIYPGIRRIPTPVNFRQCILASIMINKQGILAYAYSLLIVFQMLLS